MSTEPRRVSTFLDVPVCMHRRATALFGVLEVPFERTVSYGGGTARGPQAILKASQYVEEFDGRSIPARAGIWVAPPVNARGNADAVFARIFRSVSSLLAEGKIPVILGGEHSITAPCVKAVSIHHGPVGVVQFDAHSDLRMSYEGSKASHACVMRRILEMGCPLFQVGIRAFSEDDPDVRRRYKVHSLDAEAIRKGGIPRTLLPAAFPEKIYLTFDVDAFDSSLMPATGTPEPGGLTWDQTITILERILPGRQIVAFDIVELAPINGFHAPDFAAAKLAYAIMGMIVAGRRRTQGRS